MTRLIALCLILGSALTEAFEAPRQGYPPLATASIILQTDDIAAFRTTCKQFSKHEHLQYSEGQFMRDGRMVYQFYFKEGGAPVILVDNFRDPSRYQAIAYAGDKAVPWEPRWERFIAEMQGTLGTRAVMR